MTADRAFASDDRGDLIARILELEPSMHRAMGPSHPTYWLDIELTMSQLKLLFVLQHAQRRDGEGGAPVGELARALSVTLPTASVVIERMVERDLISREEASDDRRQKICRLTEAGAALLDRLATGSRLHTAALLAYLDGAALETVLSGMQLLIGAAGRLRDGMPPCPPTLENETRDERTAARGAAAPSVQILQVPGRPR